MKKVFQKNQMIIMTLAVVIAVAGYVIIVRNTIRLGRRIVRRRQFQRTWQKKVRQQ